MLIITALKFVKLFTKLLALVIGGALRVGRRATIGFVCGGNVRSGGDLGGGENC
jgi:hypothetical protein